MTIAGLLCILMEGVGVWEAFGQVRGCAGIKYPYIKECILYLCPKASRLDVNAGFILDAARSGRSGEAEGEAQLVQALRHQTL